MELAYIVLIIGLCLLVYGLRNKKESKYDRATTVAIATYLVIMAIICIPLSFIHIRGEWVTTLSIAFCIIAMFVIGKVHNSLHSFFLYRVFKEIRDPLILELEDKAKKNKENDT